MSFRDWDWRRMGRWWTAWLRHSGIPALGAQPLPPVAAVVPESLSEPEAEALGRSSATVPASAGRSGVGAQRRSRGRMSLVAGVSQELLSTAAVRGKLGPSGAATAKAAATATGSTAPVPQLAERSGPQVVAEVLPELSQHVYLDNASAFARTLEGVVDHYALVGLEIPLARLLDDLVTFSGLRHRLPPEAYVVHASLFLAGLNRRLARLEQRDDLNDAVWLIVLIQERLGRERGWLQTSMERRAAYLLRTVLSGLAAPPETPMSARLADAVRRLGVLATCVSTVSGLSIRVQVSRALGKRRHRAQLEGQRATDASPQVGNNLEPLEALLVEQGLALAVVS